MNKYDKEQTSWTMIGQAIRPKTLPAGASPVLIGAIFAFLYNPDAFRPLQAMAILCCILSMQMASNLFNDYFDFKSLVDQEDRLGPKRFTAQNEALIYNTGKALLLLALILGLALTLFPLNWPLLCLGLISLLTAYAYTGGPYPLSHYALGELLAFLFFGPVAVIGTFYLLTGHFSLLVFYTSLLPGFYSATIMGINNLRDREQDLRQGKKTLFNLLSEKKSRILLITFFFFSPLLTFFLDKHFFLLQMFFLFLQAKTIFAIYRWPLSKKWNFLLAKTGLFLFLNALFFSFILLLKVRYTGFVFY